jgi:hypothetical protein
MFLGGVIFAHALSVASVSCRSGSFRFRSIIEADAALVVLTFEVQIDATAAKSSSRPVMR